MIFIGVTQVVPHLIGNSKADTFSNQSFGCIPEHTSKGQFCQSGLKIKVYPNKYKSLV